LNRVEEVLNRLYLAININKDVEFCHKYGIKANTLSTWKKRDSLPYEHIENISQSENISMDWLLTGKGSMYLEERKSNLVVTHGDINSNGEGNIILNGVQDCDINHNTPSKPTKKDQTIISTEELNELCELIKEYATPRYRMEIKEKLLRFKELH